jgi:hypothetical protein
MQGNEATATRPDMHQKWTHVRLATQSNGFSKSDCQGSLAGIDLAPVQCSATVSRKPLNE